ncbi:MAG: secondary thiamine-phosphate synthase enzyme YjbQ [bacterium JZ-2024 1]
MIELWLDRKMVSQQAQGTADEMRGGSVFFKEIQVNTKGENDVHDLTGHAERAVEESGTREGFIIIFVPGSTAGVTTLEFEPGLVADLNRALERWAPSNASYHHDERWRDGNGFSHIRSALIGTSLTVPIHSGRLILGTWQQIVLVDFDNRPRSRTVAFQVFRVA